MLKCTKFDFHWGSATELAGGAYSAPLNPLTVFNRPTSNGKERKEGRGGERKRREENRSVRKGKGGEGCPKHNNSYTSCKNVHTVVNLFSGKSVKLVPPHVRF